MGNAIRKGGLVLLSFWLSIGQTSAASFGDPDFDSAYGFMTKVVYEQNADGSIGDQEEDKIRATAMAVMGFEHYNMQNSLVAQRALSFLAKSEPESVDSIARTLKVLWANNMHSPRLLERLYEIGYATGGRGSDVAYYWGGVSRETANIMDTCLVLDAFTEREKHEDYTISRDDEKLSRVVFEELLKTLRDRVLPDPNNQGDYLGWRYRQSSKPAGEIDLLPTACARLALFNAWTQSNDPDRYDYYLMAERAGGDLTSWDEATLSAPLILTYDAYARSRVNPQGFTSQMIDQLYTLYRTGPQEARPTVFAHAVGLNIRLINLSDFPDGDGDGVIDALDIDPVLPSDHWIENDELRSHESIRVSSLGGVIDYEFDFPSHYTIVPFGELPPGFTFENNRLVGQMSADTQLFTFKITGLHDAVEVHSIFFDNLDPNGDEDGDGIKNGIETCTSPFVNESEEDSDGDNVINRVELEKNLAHCREDTDLDFMPDGWEIENNTNPGQQDGQCRPFECYQVSVCLCDLDQDGLSNYVEYVNKTDPNNEDSDGDGVRDPDEINSGRKPTHNENIELMLFLNSIF